MAPFFDVVPAITAIPVGLAFGVALERAGFGVPRTIAAQLAGRDFTVMKVMFSAIVTAMLGLFWFGRLGWLDLSRLALPPTDLVPQLIGGVVFGAGFAIASLCPGTACVAAGTGRRDGLATIAGLFVGTLVTAELWPHLGRAAENLLRADATLPADLGWSRGVTVAALVAVALLAITVGGVIERRVGTERATGGTRALPILATVAITLALLAAVSDRGAAASAINASTVAPIDLAQWIHDRRADLWLIEVRADTRGEGYPIPGAESRTLAEFDTLTIDSGVSVVLYSDGPEPAAKALMLLRKRGVMNASLLRDGVEGWEREVMSPVIPPATDSLATANFARVRSLSVWFGGRPVGAPLPEGSRRKLRRNTC